MHKIIVRYRRACPSTDFKLCSRRIIISFQEATKLSLISGDQATYTRSIRVMGDIYRNKMDMDVSIAQ